VTTSREVGAEKPDYVIFSAAIKKAQVLTPTTLIFQQQFIHAVQHSKSQ
jgi:hypothetical protein